MNFDQNGGVRTDVSGTGGDSVVDPPSRPWLTVGLTLVVMVAYVTMATVVVVVFLVAEKAQHPKSNFDSWLAKAETNGDLLSASAWAATFVTVPLVLLFAWVVSGRNYREHLGLRMPGAGALLRWIVLILAFIAMADGFTWLIGRDIVPVGVREMYASTHLLVLLWLTLVFAAPVGEELLFRGFLFYGLFRTRLGPIGAAVIASLAWACVHVQYDVYGIAVIFVGGLVLGAARYFTQSVVTPICMHAVMNLVATVEVVLTN